jgi:hypothetical protein
LNYQPLNTAVNRLSRIARVYIALALLGSACMIVAYGLLALNPVIISITLLLVIAFIWIKFFHLNLRSKKNQSSVKDIACQVPPREAELLLLILLPKDRNGILGDLAEEFSHLSYKYGIRLANLWYWKQVIRFVVLLLTSQIKLLFLSIARVVKIRD